MAKASQRTAERIARSSPQRMALMLVAIVLVLAFRYWSERNAPQSEPLPPQAENIPASEATAKPQTTPKPDAKPKPSAAAPATAATDSSRLVIRNVSLRDQDNRVIYRGDIDLRPTLERIDAGKKLRFSHDGSVFQNREGRLPSQSSGYYREWVVPTPGEDGPGPQRIVTGSAGEAWYTADHYRTFQRIQREAGRDGDSKNRRNDE